MKLSFFTSKTNYKKSKFDILNSHHKEVLFEIFLKGQICSQRTDNDQGIKKHYGQWEKVCVSPLNFMIIG